MFLTKLIKYPIFKRIVPSLMRKILTILNKNRGYFKVKSFQMYLDFLDPIDREIILFNEFEKEEINLLIKYLKANRSKIFLDIGSNCGYYSVIISSKKFIDKVYAFDPNQEANLKFTNTLEKNLNLKNKIKLYKFGLSNINSKLKVKSLRKNNYTQTGGTSVFRKYTKGTYVETLESFKKGDDLLNFNKLRLGIKIDVEGYELEVLRGIKNILKNNKCIIQIEIFKRNYSKVYNFLSAMNYRLVTKVDKRSNYFFKSL